MNCPVCNTVALVMADRQGVEIDYCPQCRGVWLDRGELDKIIERANVEMAPPARPAAPPQATPPPAPAPYPGDYRHRGYDNDYKYRNYGSDYYKHKKKKSILGEIFDF